MDLKPNTAALKAVLDAMPGVEAVAPPGPGGRPPPALMYKVSGKIFAILATGRNAWVVLKADPHLIEILKETYSGAKHRTHLDRRFWISLDLDGDVPPDEIERLAAGSYDLVAASLTRAQRATLAAR